VCNPFSSVNKEVLLLAGLTGCDKTTHLRGRSFSPFGGNMRTDN
jgi:hypothetical protein